MCAWSSLQASWTQTGTAANPACVVNSSENSRCLCRDPCLKVSCCETVSSVPSRVCALILRTKGEYYCAYSRALLPRPIFVVDVYPNHQSLSCYFRPVACRWRSPPRLRRHGACIYQVGLECLMLPTQVTLRKK